MKKMTLLLTLSFLQHTTLVSAQKESSSPHLIRSMGVLGDSISAGFLSKHSRGNPSSLQTGFLLQQLINSRWMKGASKAFETPETSWAGGFKQNDGVESHFKKLSRLNLSSPIKLHNAAVSGAESNDVLVDQIRDLQTWSRNNLKQESPDYVTLLVGANDICAKNISEMIPVQDFERNIALIIERTVGKSPRTTLLLSSLPNIENLRKVALNARVFKDKPLTCGDLWKSLKICPTLTTLEGPDRLAVKERVEQYNLALATLSAEYNKLYPNQIIYSSALYETEFTENHLSVDCFHPNAKGHALISEKTWPF